MATASEDLLGFVYPPLEGGAGPACGTRGCPVERTAGTGWMRLDPAGIWNLEFRCPEHGTILVHGGEWRSWIDQVLERQANISATSPGMVSPRTLEEEQKHRSRAARDLRRGTNRKPRPLPPGSPCYCDTSPEEIRARNPGREVPKGFCGFCERCDAPGHVRLRRRPFLHTGVWCDRCLSTVQVERFLRSGWFKALALAAGIAAWLLWTDAWRTLLGGGE